MTWVEQLTVAFDVDLGELVEGRHIVARGVEFGETGALLHYRFVPGIEAGRPLIELADLGLQRGGRRRRGTCSAWTST